MIVGSKEERWETIGFKPPSSDGSFPIIIFFFDYEPTIGDLFIFLKEKC